VATHIYAELQGTLPGPAHPAVSVFDSPALPTPSAYERGRMASWLLWSVVGGAQIPQMIRCPEMQGILPDSYFAEFKQQTSRRVFPVCYGLNNWGLMSSDSSAPDPTNSYPRYTKPAGYFGLSSPPPGDPAHNTAPLRMSEIPNAEREWMMADAWYRSRSNLSKFPRQEGPYQSAWSGEALPYFAPHLRRAPVCMSVIVTYERVQAAARLRAQANDGVTNTLFFDGHAASEPPRRKLISGFEVFYGFRGTVNADPLYESGFEGTPWE
jgi:prepilin-type processing-associated H-X9-DG protein